MNHFVINPTEKKEIYNLSSVQKRLFFIQQLDTSNIAYNITDILPLDSKDSIKEIESIFKKIVQRHEILRSSFEIIDGIPCQKIHDNSDVKIDIYEEDDLNINRIVKKHVKPFDLSTLPLIRINYIKSGNLSPILLIDLHHIIFDATSNYLFYQEFNKLKNNHKLRKQRIQYKDYSEWQVNGKNLPIIKKQREYWNNKFKLEPPKLNLPSDYKRPIIKSYEGSAVRFVLGEHRISALNAMSQAFNMSLFTTIFTIFNILLSKVSNQDDIVVGVPIRGRNNNALLDMMGMFVNTLPLRSVIDDSKTFIDVLLEVKKDTLLALEYQDYQLGDLINDLSIERDQSREPLFDVMFDFLNQQEYKIDLGKEKIENKKETQKEIASQYDISLKAIDLKDNMYIIFEYCTGLFKEETITRFIDYFITIVESIKENINIRIKEIDILSKEEKQKLLYKFNDTEVDYPKEKTIYQLFEEQVAKTPDNIAVFTKDKSYNYKELQVKVKELAIILRSKGVTLGNVVGLILDRSVEMMVGIMGILRLGCCYLPIHPNTPKPRLEYIIRDSESILILIQTKYQDKLAEKAEYLDMENLSGTSSSQQELSVQNNPKGLAYIIYTSGSTGEPKGVMIENHSVVNRLKWMQKNYPIGSGDIVLQKTPYTFDVSVWELFWWSFEGASVFMLEPEWEKDPVLIAQAISEKKINVMHFVPSMLETFLNVIKDDTNNYNLESLKYVFSSGETLKPHQVISFYKLFSKNVNTRLINLYGPTEATIDVSYFDCLRDVDYKIIPIGKPIDNTQLYILDKDTLQLQATGVVGELMISGVGLSRGYIKQDKLTSEKFINHPFKSGEKLYKTGDLARWLSDGNIEFLGRIDHQVKIRGFRIELGEIENALLKHEKIKESAVLVIKVNNDKYLCAYIMVEGDFNQEELRAFLSASLPDYMIPSYFVKLDSLPLTTNGKINRRAFPLPEIKAGEDYIAPSNEIEEKLVGIWSEVLDVAKEEISVEANFFSIGGHSLKAATLTGKIHKEFEVELPLRDIFIYPTISSQSLQIKSRDKKDFIVIPKAKEQDSYSLSSAQRRLFLLQKMDLESTTYNMPYTIPLDRELDKYKIEKVFLRLISRHESFRTSFEIEEEEPVQRIHEQVEFKIEELNIEKGDEQNKINQFVKAFDLSQAPLLRVSKVNKKGEGSLLMIDMHHIISDGVSHNILEREFQSLISGEDLPPLSLQYKDYSEWQNSEEQKARVKGQESYWINKFEGEIPVLSLPYDYSRPVIQSHKGASVSFALSIEETKNIKLLVKENGLTLYMSILAIYSILLSKLSNQEDIIIGSPVAGRNHPDLGNIVGAFVNTLAIRIEVYGSNTLKEFIGKLKQNTLETYENQDYQFEDLVEKVSVDRDVSRNPLFDVMFNFLNQAEYSGDLSRLDAADYVHRQRIAKFDLTLTGIDYGDQLMFSFEYCTKLFKPVTIEKYIKYFKQLLNQITQNLDRKLSEIEIITEEEKQQLLYEFNNTKINYPKDKTIYHLFEEQKEKSPLNIAVHCNGASINYNDLSKKSGCLASYIYNIAGENGVIGLMADRSIEMIIGILAVLKSGNAYLPLDVKHPKERNYKILKESEVSIVLSNNEDLKLDDFNVVSLLNPEAYPKKVKFESKNISSTDPAYVIYTSGSTGVPKGVVVTHRNVVNLVKGISGLLPENNSSKILSLTTISFDIFGLELYTPLLNGHSMVLAKDKDQYSTEKIASIVKSQEVNIMQLTPSRLSLMLADKFSGEIFNGIEVLFVGGEELPAELLSNLRDLYNGKVYNMYGPTETTIWSTFKDVSGELPLNIGKPINNTQVYILGLQNELSPIGVPGELCISGDGLALGYLNNSELTGKKFVNNPYKPDEQLYKTGDLARWLPDGNIEFLGRLDHQVKIRGYRIELGEIESVLNKIEAIKNCVLVAKDDTGGNKRLVAYIVSSDELNIQELRASLSTLLPDYMIPSLFVSLENMPLTPNGKIDRKALPKPEGIVETTNEYLAPRNKIEQKLADIWTKVLGVEKVGVYDNFFELGGHSFKLIQVINKIADAFNIKFEFPDLYKHQSIAETAPYIKAKQKETYIIKTKNEELIEPGTDKYEYFDAPPGSAAFYVLGRYLKEINLRSFDMSLPKLNWDVFKKTWEVIIERHEALRTTFHYINSDFKIKILPLNEYPYHIKYVNLINEPNKKELLDKIIKKGKVDFENGPIYNIYLVDISNKESLIILSISHIIYDGWSVNVLINEFQEVYGSLEKNMASTLPKINFGFLDYVKMRNNMLKGYRGKELKEFWYNYLSGNMPQKTITDVLSYSEEVQKRKKSYKQQLIEEFSFHPSLSVEKHFDLFYGVEASLALSQKGTGYLVVLNQEMKFKLDRMLKEIGCSNFSFFIAGLNILSYKLTGEACTFVCSPFALRDDIKLNQVVGFLVNNTIIANKIDNRYTINEFVKKVFQSTNDAYLHKYYQMEQALKDLDISIHKSSAFYINNETDESTLKTDISRFESSHVEYPVTPWFDIDVSVKECSNGFEILIKYKEAYFRQDTIGYIFTEYENILKQMIENPSMEIEEMLIRKFH